LKMIGSVDTRQRVYVGAFHCAKFCADRCRDVELRPTDNGNFAF